MTQTEGKIYHARGLEESILLKWPKYSRQSIDVMQFLSNYQWCFFTELEQLILKLVWKYKRPWIAKIIWGKKKRAGGITPWLQTVTQSYSNQNSMVLAQKQTHRSMEQDRKPRNKSTHLRSINLQQRKQDHTMKKRQSFK